MLYCSWDAVCDGCNCYFSFWAILFPFTLLTAQKKMKNSKQWKKGLGISFYTSVPNIMIICYTVPEISHVLNVIVFFTLGNFSPFIPLTTQNMKNSKQRKRHLEISSINTSVPKVMIICYIAPEIWHMADAIVIFYFWLFLPLIWCMTDVTIFHFGLSFVLYPLKAQKITFSKKWKEKMPGYIIILI